MSLVPLLTFTLASCEEGPAVRSALPRASRSAQAATSGAPADAAVLASTSVPRVGSASPSTAFTAPAVRSGVAKRIGNSAVQDSGEPTQWPRSCQIWRACQPLPRLPRCDPALDAVDAMTILGASAPWRAGEPLAVRGPLGLFTVRYGGPGCDSTKTCCAKRAVSMFVGTPPRGMFIGKYGCFGDESRRCCTAPAFGQEVIARGTLVALSGKGNGVFWRLADPELCETGKADRSNEVTPTNELKP